MDEEDGFSYNEYYCNGIGDDDDGDWDEDEYFDNYTEEKQEEMEEEDAVDVNSKVDDEGDLSIFKNKTFVEAVKVLIKCLS